MSASNLFSLFTWQNFWRVLEVAFILLIGFLVSYLIRKEMHKFLIRKGNERIARSASRGIYYVLICIVILIAISSLGISLAGVLVAGGILGIILGLALQTIISNFISGILLYLEKPFKMGDLIEVEGEVGKVLEIGALSTRILGMDGIERRIPNEKIFTGKMKNYSSGPCLRVELKVGISYDSNLEKAKRAIIETLSLDPYILEDPSPIVFLDELGDYSISIKAYFWIPSEKILEVKSIILERIFRSLRKEEIEIPFPRLEVKIK